MKSGLEACAWISKASPYIQYSRIKPDKKEIAMEKQKKAVFFDSHLPHERIGYAVKKGDRVPAGLCVSEKDLKKFANKTERSLINFIFLMRDGVKFLAMYYVAKKFGLDVENVEFDGYWYKIPVPKDNLAVPTAMLSGEKTSDIRGYLSFAIIRDER